MTTTELRMCRAIEAHLGCDPIPPASLADHGLLSTVRLDRNEGVAAQVAVLRTLLEFDQATGRFTWRPRCMEMFSKGQYSQARLCSSWNARFAGAEALNSQHSSGYLHGRIFDRLILAHRAAWIHHYGVRPDFIDHISGDKAENRIVNLRDVTKSENARNMAMSKSNTSGVMGVCQVRGRRWRAYIRVGDKNRHLGCFGSLEEAARARKAADQANGYHPNHGRIGAKVTT